MELTREQVIARTTVLLNALLKGYILQSSYGYTLKVDEFGYIWVKDKQTDEWTQFIFNVDVRFLQKEACALSEVDYQSIRSFVNEVDFIKE